MGSLLTFFGALTAACFDLETRRIPNALVLFLWGTAICLTFTGNGNGVKTVAAGAFLPVIFLWPLFKLRALGAGDIKLLSGIGALAGPFEAASVFAFAVLCASAISALLILSEGYSSARRMRIHFAVPIFMGVMISSGRGLL